MTVITVVVDVAEADLGKGGGEDFLLVDEAAMMGPAGMRTNPPLDRRETMTGKLVTL